MDYLRVETNKFLQKLREVDSRLYLMKKETENPLIFTYWKSPSHCDEDFIFSAAVYLSEETQLVEKIIYREQPVPLPIQVPLTPIIYMGQESKGTLTLKDPSKADLYLGGLQHFLKLRDISLRAYIRNLKEFREWENRNPTKTILSVFNLI